MTQDHGEVTPAEVRRLLDQFAASRAHKPRKEAEAEYGDVLLYLILLAGKAGVDLLAGANRELDVMARDRPQLADRIRG
jgi:hypothetical protein